MKFTVHASGCPMAGSGATHSRLSRLPLGKMRFDCGSGRFASHHESRRVSLPTHRAQEGAPLAVIEAVVELAERFGSKVATAAEARKLMKIGAFVLGIRNSSGEVSRRVNTRWLLRMPTRGTVRSRDSVSSRPKHR